MTWQVLEGDCRDMLATLPEGSVHTCVTSPPYFGLRDYGHDGQIGLEPTPDEFVAALVAVFREVRRVLRDDGTAWLNLGDSYNSAPPGNKNPMRKSSLNGAQTSAKYRERLEDTQQRQQEGRSLVAGCKPKDLLGIPWMVAFALRADGWYLRSDIIWAKPNPMPESVTDRPTKAHEYLFLLSRAPRYYYDADAIREDAQDRPYSGDLIDEFANGTCRRTDGSIGDNRYARGASGYGHNPAGRNKRTVWTVTTQPYAGAHFATFPPKLIEPCILAGAPERACSVCGAPWVRIVERTPTKDGESYESRMERWGESFTPAHQGGRSFQVPGRYNLSQSESRTLGFEPSCTHNAEPVPGVVLDPFAGAGTTGIVALRHSRSFVGVELNPEYAELARWRIRDDAPLLNTGIEVAA